MSTGQSKPKVVSLFTGAGGLDIGLEQAGFETIFATDIEEYACMTIKSNTVFLNLSEEEFDQWFEAQLQQRCYRKLKKSEKQSFKARLAKGLGGKTYMSSAVVLQGDLREIGSEQIMDAAKVNPGEVDLVVGGPPCQPFSRAGKGETVESPKGRLFMEFVRVVDDLRPQWFLFENVKGLAQTKTEILRTRCVTCGHTKLASFDIRIRWTPCSSKPDPCSKCSGPQEWQVSNEKGGSLEIIVSEFKKLGYTCYVNLLNAVDYGAPQFRERLFIIGSREGEKIHWPSPTHFNGGESLPIQGSLFDDLGSCRKRWVSVGEALFSEGHPKFGELGEAAVLWVKNVVRPHAEPVTWTLDRPAPTIGAHQGAKLAIAPLGVPEKQLARQQWHTLGRRQGDTPPVEVKHAYLLDLDLLILQTFPEHWYLYGTRMQRAFQIGNAVPPVFGKILGEAILQAMNHSVHTVPFNTELGAS